MNKSIFAAKNLHQIHVRELKCLRPGAWKEECCQVLILSVVDHFLSEILFSIAQVSFVIFATISVSPKTPIFKVLRLYLKIDAINLKSALWTFKDMKNL